jgi:hypothetical protein
MMFVCCCSSLAAEKQLMIIISQINYAGKRKLQKRQVATNDKK